MRSSTDGADGADGAQENSGITSGFQYKILTRKMILKGSVLLSVPSAVPLKLPSPFSTIFTYLHYKTPVIHFKC